MRFVLMDGAAWKDTRGEQLMTAGVERTGNRRSLGRSYCARIRRGEDLSSVRLTGRDGCDGELIRYPESVPAREGRIHTEPVSNPAAVLQSESR